MSSKPVLIYDGDCKFCQLSLEYGIRHMKVFPLYVAFQKIEPSSFGLTEKQVRSEIWLVSEGSDITLRLGGHLAAAAILQMQANPVYWLAGFLMKTPPMSWLAKIVYRWIARNRHRLPGGTKECSIQDNYLAGG
jgi:predicted DCC family thiol-disulfide oxidoreductase YuxK